MCVYIYIYIYIYIHTHIYCNIAALGSLHPRDRSAHRNSDDVERFLQEGTGSVRFVSVPDFSKIHRFGSVRFGSENIFPGSTRFGLRFSDASWLGPVRFGSVPCPVPASSRIKLFGSVRFGSVRFGSVRFCRLGPLSNSFLIRRPGGKCAGREGSRGASV